MTQLRWVLLALGALIILAVYLKSRGLPDRLRVALRRRRGLKRDATARYEPVLSNDSVPDSQAYPAPEDAPEGDPPEPEPDPPAPVESVVTLGLIPRERQLASNKVVLALRAAGLRHGRYGIFHMHASNLDDEALFSVASLTEPGSFDLSRLAETTIAGVSFFMVLPGTGDPVDRFDRMVATARELARKLDGELHDEKGSSWSIQRERYVREEVIEYRHSLDRYNSS